jgi:hypothetical protein
MIFFETSIHVYLYIYNICTYTCIYVYMSTHMHIYLNEYNVHIYERQCTKQEILGFKSEMNSLTLFYISLVRNTPDLDLT